MRIYTIYDSEGNFNAECYDLNEAKRIIKRINGRGTATSVRSNGDWIPLGEIKVGGNNMHCIANTKATTGNYI